MLLNGRQIGDQRLEGAGFDVEDAEHLAQLGIVIQQLRPAVEVDPAVVIEVDAVEPFPHLVRIGFDTKFLKKNVFDKCFMRNG